MPLFHAYSPDTEVSGRIISPVAFGIPNYADLMSTIFSDYGKIEDIQIEQWYNQQNFLDVLKVVLEKFGPNTAFTLGKRVTESYPHQFTNLKTALLAVDQIYQANHRNGDAGYCKLFSFSAERKLAELQCFTPYPAEFQRGLLVSMARKYKGFLGLAQVKLLRPNGDALTDLNAFKISW